MKPHFQTQYDLEARKPEENNGISKTIPDHALTIKQIMENHTIGSLVEQKQGRYHDETGESEELIGVETGQIMEKLDHHDIHEKAMELKERAEQRDQEEKRERIENFKKQTKERDEKLKKQWEEEQKKNQEPKKLE